MKVLLVTVLIVFVLAMVGALDVYEDGSWALGDVHGCLPGGQCND